MRTLLFFALLLPALAKALNLSQMQSNLWVPTMPGNTNAYMSCFKDTRAGSHYASGYAYTSNYSETAAGSGVPNANATRRIRSNYLATTDMFTVTDPYSGNLVQASRSVVNWSIGAVGLNIFYNHGGGNRQLTIPVGSYGSTPTGGIRTQYGLVTSSIFSTIVPAYGSNVRIYQNYDLIALSIISSYLKVTVTAPNGQNLNFFFDCVNI